MSHAETERQLQRFRDAPLRPGEIPQLPRGSLLMIGGHEEADDDPVILRALARQVGGGRLVIATLATEHPDRLWKQYESLFRRLGVADVAHLHLEDRQEAGELRALRILDAATAILFTGGDQLRITSTLGDTPVFSRIFEIFLEGGIVAGTAAGASVLSETTLLGGGTEASPRVNAAVQLGPGFGFARDVIIDHHFAHRGRIDRLLGVVAQNPRVLGLGIDAHTAVLLRPGRDFRVLGRGAVTVLDGQRVTSSSVTEDELEQTLSVFNITLHLLSQGDRFDLRTRRPMRRADASMEASLDPRGRVAHDGDRK